MLASKLWRNSSPEFNLQGAESSGELAYWLSTTSTLLYLLQNTLKASSSSSKGSNRSRTATGSLFSRMVLVSSPSRLLFCMNKGFYLRLQRQVCQGPHNTGHWQTGRGVEHNAEMVKATVRTLMLFQRYNVLFPMYFFFLRRQDFSSQLSSSTMD